MEQNLTAAATTFSATERRPDQPAADAFRAEQYVIAIGASAGGLEAITEFFDHLPADTEASFIIIQHLSPDHKSLMAELLAKHTQLTITQAEEGMHLRPNSIYLIPNRNTMTLRHGRLRLAEKPLHKAPNMAIDIFFSSLAHDQGRRSIGIILSGTGSDGTRGLEAIKAAGGLVLVQEPSSANFNGMPNSAIATGLADAVLPPKEMPHLVNQYLLAAPGVHLPNKIPAPKNTDTNQLLEEILEYTRVTGGLDFTSYKRPTLTRRIAKRMMANDIDTYEKYLDLLKNSPEEVKQLCNEFLINVTHFFRDERAFALLEEKIIPEIVRHKTDDDAIKIWVAGCSTGEEPYSLAMLFDIYLNKHQIHRAVKIFATDIDKEVIQYASKGAYPASVAPSLPPRMLSQYFVRRNDDYVICEQIRKMVIFAHHDVTKDAPFSKVDLISCRNMLIYMNSSLQQKVLNSFHFALNVGGYLFLGPSENLGKLTPHFSEISRKWKLFKNIEASRKTLMQHVTVRSLNINSRASETMPVRKSRPNLHQSIGDIFNATIVEEYSYAGVCIDESFRLLHAIGDYKKYLDLPDWQLHLNLIKMVPEEVAVAISTSVRKAIKTNQKVTLHQVKLIKDGITRAINIILKPFISGEYSEQFVFVLFSEAAQQNNHRKSITSEAKYTLQNDQLAALEQELNETKENLFATFQELEVSNEELQSNNEELLSANEELQSTNEELQSLNEELHTVNTEHQQKIKELIELNEDLDNYFRNADIGQMFVDQNLTIRKFTPAIVNQINLIPGDIGRPLAHFSNNLKYDFLLEDIQEVISTGQPLEKEIEIRSGKYYLMRLMPYLKHTNKPDGVVITFVDITALKHLNNTLEGILNSSLNGIIALKAMRVADKQIADFEYTLVNEAAGKLLKKDAHWLTGKKLLQEMPGFKKSRLFGRLVQVVLSGEPLNTEHYYEHDGLQAWFHIMATKVVDGLTITFADITDKKLADQNLLTAYQELQSAEENLKKLNAELEERITERTRALSLSEERFRLISMATNDAIWDWSLMNNELWWNEGFKTMFAYTSEQIEPGVESWFKRIHPDDKDRIINSVNEAIDSSKEQWLGEYRFRKADGSYAYVVNRAFIMHTENHIPYRMLGSLIDLTNLKMAQEELRKTNSDLIRINNDLDNFVYTASHDLKSPISNIEGLLYHLELELENTDEHITEILSHIKKSVDRFQTTIKDLTEISKVDKHEEDDVTDVNIAELLDDVKISIHSMIQDSGATIEIDCQECPEIKFSKKNLRSILYNLVNNSVKYRDPARPLIIKVSAQKTPEYSVLTVQDNGLGIDEAQQPKLFSMFKRFHNHVEGSGVGLYILNKIVDNAQGKIEVQSKVGVGTTFRIYLKNPA